MAVYPITPHRIKNVKPAFKTGVIEFENGVEQRYPNWSAQKKTFRLEHYALSTEQQETFEDFFEEMKGQYGSFSFYNHRDGKTYNVRFAQDELDFEAINAGLANLTVEVVTC